MHGPTLAQSCSTDHFPAYALRMGKNSLPTGSDPCSMPVHCASIPVQMFSRWGGCGLVTISYNVVLCEVMGWCQCVGETVFPFAGTQDIVFGEVDRWTLAHVMVYVFMYCSVFICPKDNRYCNCSVLEVGVQTRVKLINLRFCGGVCTCTVHVSFMRPEPMTAAGHEFESLSG